MWSPASAQPFEILLQFCGIEALGFEPLDRASDGSDSSRPIQSFSVMIEGRKLGILRDRKLKCATVAELPFSIEPDRLYASANQSFPEGQIFGLAPARRGERGRSDHHGVVAHARSEEHTSEL